MRIAALLLAAAMLQGCAAIPVAAAVGVMGVASDGDEAGVAPSAPVPAAPVSGTPAEISALPVLGTLPPQDLAPGACALFLFTRDGNSSFAVFAPSDGGALVLSLDGETQTLPALSPFAESPDAFTQTYRNVDGVEARLAAALGDPLPQGRVAPSASLRLAAPGGAAQVTPLSGLVACEAAS